MYINKPVRTEDKAITRVSDHQRMSQRWPLRSAPAANKGGKLRSGTLSGTSGAGRAEPQPQHTPPS
jgi:hypothetical protein